MEILSTEFFSALLAIVIIDLVLAGDNAIVIALAARNLPPHLRGKAVAWGTIGAIVVRSAMTLIVVWLLNIPGLLLVGGALLLWIAYKLLLPQEEGEDGHGVTPVTGFWAAMKTIIVADAVMGLDNVLAVAGAAQGSFLLVVLGLLISIPIVIWGSQLILKYVQRYPVIIYIGAAVLLWTAVKMMTSEPFIKDYVAMAGNFVALFYVATILGVLGAGFWANHGKVRSRVSALEVSAGAEPVSDPVASLTALAESNAMARVLIPVDGSENSLQAVRRVVNRFLANPGLEVHLLHVRAPFSQHVSYFVKKRDRDVYHREQADKALSGARSLLEKFGVPHAVHIEFGNRAERIASEAQRLRVDRIVMGTARKNSLTRILEDSVTSRLLEITQVPVEVVAGKSISRVERIGVPAGIVAMLLAVIVTGSV